MLIKTITKSGARQILQMLNFCEWHSHEPYNTCFLLLISGQNGDSMSDDASLTQFTFFRICQAISYMGLSGL